MKEHENCTLLLDEAIVESGEAHNLFLCLLELRRCDAESTFKTVETSY